jgi:predicted amidohydrolase YtcJ
VAAALERGFSVAIHAIGDRGNRVALDALEQGWSDAHKLRPELPPIRDLRVRVEHAQILAPEDLPRFARLGIIPSMQPTHCTSDMPWAPKRLGSARLAGAYAWRSLRDSGCILPLGSDFPVEDVSPLLGLYAARTRRPLPDAPGSKDAPARGWSPEQCLTPLEALLGFTTWPALAAGVEQWGRLTEGCRADLTVLDGDPLADDPQQLLRMRATMTLVEGAPAWTATRSR